MHKNHRAQQQWQDLLGESQEAASQLWDLTEGYADTGVSPNVDQAWNRLAAQLPQAAASSNVGRPRRYLRWVGAAAAAIALLVVVNIFSASDASHQRFVNAKDAMMPIELSDESSVELMPGAELMFSAYEDTREATLSGTAHFEVTSDRARPFTIRGGGFEVLVVGTEFTVSTGSTAEITVDEGHVRVRGSREADWMDLYAGDAASIVDQLAIKQPVSGLVNDDLRFVESRLEEVTKMLVNSRVAEIAFDPMLKDCKLTADFTGSSAQDIADALAVLFSAELRNRGDRFELVGGKCR